MKASGLVMSVIISLMLFQMTVVASFADDVGARLTKLADSVDDSGIFIKRTMYEVAIGMKVLNDQDASSYIAVTLAERLAANTPEDARQLLEESLKYTTYCYFINLRSEHEEGMHAGFQYAKAFGGLNALLKPEYQIESLLNSLAKDEALSSKELSRRINQFRPAAKRLGINVSACEPGLF